MISINDVFKIRLGYPIRLTEFGVYGLRVENWIDGAAYIKTEIKGDRL